MGRRTWRGSLTIVLCSWSTLTAQVAPIRSGDRIRITPGCAGTSRAPQCRPVTGRFLSRSGDTLAVQSYRETPVVMGIDSLTRLELSAGRHHHTLLGLGVGTLAGIGAGALWSNDCKNGFGSESNCELAYLVTIPLGALAGTIIGATIVSDRWRPVVMTPLQEAHGVPKRRDLRLGIGLRF
jgi:hypothetical protein